MSEAASVRVENLHKSFNEGREHVLRGITVGFPAGGLTYVLGPSGTGKSVLLKHILGLMRPDRGSVWVDGTNIAGLRGSALSRQRMLFGVLFQNSALFDNMNVFDNVAFPLREHTGLPEQEIAARVISTLEHLGMPDGYDKLPNQLSGGMKKRVGLARAIIREPRILLYDEPTTGLDPVTRHTVDELIGRMKKELKLTSIVISHDIPSALRHGDQIVFLYKGEAVFSGVPRDFRNADHPAIQEFLAAEHQAASSFLQ